MGQATHRITGIIPSCRDESQIERAVSSLEQCLVQSGFEYELIIVDDGWRPDFAGKLDGLNVKLIESDMIFNGFGLAVNNALEHSELDSDYLVIMHDDVAVPDSLQLANIVEIMENEPGVSVVSPKNLHPNGWLSQTYYVFGITQMGSTEIRSELKHWYKECNAANEPGPVKAVPCGFWVVKREKFTEVGGFSPEYSPALLEDLDFCLKIRDKDGVILYLPQYEVVHETKVSVNNEYLDMNRIGNTNLEKIVNRWNGNEVFNFEVGM